MRKLHMGTMSYGADAMDEVAHQLAVAFGADQSKPASIFGVNDPYLTLPRFIKTRFDIDWRAARDTRTSRHVLQGPRCGVKPCSLSQRGLDSPFIPLSTTHATGRLPQ